MLHIMRARARVRRPAADYVENVVALEASPFASNPLAAERERAAAAVLSPNADVDLLVKRVQWTWQVNENS